MEDWSLRPTLLSEHGTYDSRFPLLKSAAHRDQSREWGRLKAKGEPLFTLGNSGDQNLDLAYRSKSSRPVKLFPLRSKAVLKDKRQFPVGTSIQMGCSVCSTGVLFTVGTASHFCEVVDLKLRTAVALVLHLGIIAS